MQKFISSVLFTSAISLSAGIALAQDKALPQTLFVNVHVFDGVSEKRLENASVLVEGNLIKQVSASAIDAPNASVIDGDGRTLMPGLIDTHAHPSVPLQLDTLTLDVDWMQWGATSASVTTEYLLRGWTTVRDTGGPAMGLQRTIDAGNLVGPRIYPSGATISQTSGHGDHRRYNIQHPNFPNQNPIGIFQSPVGLEVICDGVPEVLRCTREVLRTGAAQIKLHAGGGASTSYDPLYTVQYQPEELEAAVKTARDYGTYVMVHAYNDESIIRSLDAGVRSIEHGQLMTERSMKKLIEHDAWISPYYAFMDTPREDLVAYVGAENAGKLTEIYEGAERQIKLLIDNNYRKVAFGADVIGPPENHRRNNVEFKIRARYWSNVEVLRQATSINAELLKESGPRDPYPLALGVIQVGAYADILLIDGNPLDDITLLSDTYDEAMDLIMKDGVIYKNTLN
ncbi:MAG: amidohydrolase family protein [Rhizobiaceae bacterium]